MPLRPDLLTKRWFNIELPILPFLAPRVFTPWPTQRRRSYTTTRVAPQVDAKRKHSNKGVYREEWPRCPEETQRDVSKEKHEGEDAKPQDSSSTNLGKTYAATLGENSSGPSNSLLPGEDFRKRFEDTWEGGMKLPPFPARDPTPFPNYTGVRPGRIDQDLEEQEVERKARHVVRLSREQLQQERVQIWSQGFALLPDPETRTSKVPGLSKLLLPSNPETSAVVEALVNIDNTESLRKAWKLSSLEERKAIWPSLMISTLNEHPDRGLEVLAATNIKPYALGYAVRDVFHYIATYQLRNQSAGNPKAALEIFTFLKYMLKTPGLTRRFFIRQNTVHLLQKNLDPASVQDLFRTLSKYGYVFHRNTLLHFPAKLRLSGGEDERISMLQKLSEAGADFNSPEVTSVCVTLLQVKNRTSAMTYSDSEIFAYMLECGMMPNIVIYNVLLQNALENGDYETGWQIHDMMVENGVDTDAYTYSLLLYDAKLRNDQPSIEHIINIVTRKKVRNAHIVTDLLHIISLYHGAYKGGQQKYRPADPFPRMLSVYREYFPLEPLKYLIPWLEDSDTHTGTDSERTLLKVSTPTLVVMLTAYLRQLKEPSPAVQFYNHFCNLVKSGDPVAASLSDTTQVYNVILKVLGSFKESLALCPRLIGAMLSQNHTVAPESKQRAEVSDSQTSKPIARRTHNTMRGKHGSAEMQATPETSHQSAQLAEPGKFPMPDVYTWSVLLKAFMDHSQPRAAEKVLTMMRSRGVYPNQVTWNTLIVGYARMQDMSMTVASVARLQRSGFGLDDFGLRGLAYFENRRALIESMKASEVENFVRAPTKRPVSIGLANSALKKTLRMVEKDGLYPFYRLLEDGRGKEGASSMDGSQDDSELPVSAVSELHVEAISRKQSRHSEGLLRGAFRSCP